MELNESQISRRRLLQAFGIGAVAIGAGGALAACSSGGGGATASTGVPTPTASPKKGGTLRVGLSVSSPTETLDPNKMAVSTDWAHSFMLYDLLTYPDPSTYELKNRIADEISSNATGDVWTVRLKQGVEFHNGKTLSADDLIYSVNAMLAGYPAPSLYFVDPKGMKKLDPLTVEFNLKSAFAEFPQAFAGSNQFIIPTDFDPAKPVGTGAFKLVSFKPGDRASFVRNPNYWGDEVFLDGVETIDLNDNTARVNALLGGQVDAIMNVPYDQVTSLKGNSAVSVMAAETSSWQPIVMAIDMAPFDNPKVREAFRLIAQRAQLVAQAYVGNGVVANDLFQQFDPAYQGKVLPQREQDLEKAKSLLKEAGQENMVHDMVVANLASGMIEGAQVFAQQASQAGVTINLRQVEPGDFFGPDYLKRPLTVDLNCSTVSYLTTCSLWTGPNAPYDATHMQTDKEYVDLYYQASKTMDANARKAIEAQMQKIEYDRGGYLNYGFAYQVDAFSSKLAGFIPDKVGWPLGFGSTYGFGSVGFTA